MTSRRRRALFKLCAIAIVVVPATFAMRELSRAAIFPGCAEPIPDRDALAAIVPRARVVEYETDDGIRLRGVLAPAASASAGARLAVFFHGNADSAAQNLFVARRLSDAGIDTFLAEYRGYGGMPGRPSEDGLYRDAEAAIAAVASSAAARERLVLVGRSLGSGVAVEMARRGHGRGLVLVSPFTSITDVARRFLGPLAPLVIGDRFDSIAKIAALDVPIAILHGDRDRVVPFELGKKLAAASARARFIALERCDHDRLGDLGEVVERGIAALGATSARSP